MVKDECREALFERLWLDTNGGCDKPAANFWHEEGWRAAQNTQREEWERVSKELNRLALIIEHAVRFFDGSEHENYKDVMAMLIANAALAYSEGNSKG